jgi:hypothetical protein
MALLKDQFSLNIQDGFSFYSVVNAAVLNYYKPSSEEEGPQLTEEQQRAVDEAKQRAQENYERAQGRRR